MLAKTDRYVGLFLRTDYEHDKENAENDVIRKEESIYKVGCFAQVQNMNLLESNIGMQITLVGVRRIDFGSIINFGPPARASVNHWNEQKLARSQGEEKARHYTNEVKAYLNELRYSVR